MTSAIRLQRTPFPPPGVRRALRAARIIHPFPTLLNTAAVAGLAFVATRGAPDGFVLARMLMLMLCAQSAIGVVNDYFDRELDAGAKPWKPIVARLVSPSRALQLAAALIIATMALGVTLGAASFAFAMLGLAAGLAYDMRLKRTVFSAVPYMVGITTLPLWVWATLGEWHDALWWLLPIGALIGLSLHLQNTIADIDEDLARGVSGMPHRLGANRAMLLAWASFALALGATAALIPFIDYDLRAYAPSVAVASLMLAISVAAYVVRHDERALQLGFGLLGIGAAVIATGWLAAVS